MPYFKDSGKRVPWPDEAQKKVIETGFSKLTNWNDQISVASRKHFLNVAKVLVVINNKA